MKTMRLKLISGVLSLSLLVGHAETSQANPNGDFPDKDQITMYVTTLVAATLFACWAFGRLCRRPNQPTPTERTQALGTPVTNLLLIRQLRETIAELQEIGGAGGAAGGAAAATVLTDDQLTGLGDLLHFVRNPDRPDIDGIRLEWIRPYGARFADAIRTAGAARREETGGDDDFRRLIDAARRLAELLQTPTLHFGDPVCIRILNEIIAACGVPQMTEIK